MTTSHSLRDKLQRLSGLLTVTLAASAGTLSAQVSSDVSSSSDEDIVVLSPFEVSSAQDAGYLAGNTMMGGRLNTQLKDTAASISVITREFLDDLGIYNFTDAAGWVPNSVSQYEATGENQFNDYNARFRNLSNNAQSRNFFTWFVNADSYNTERIDFSRGPNSVVFGTADIGGVGNVSTKQAGPRERYQASFLTSDFGGYRITADLNQPITDNWFVRINALTEDLNGWRNFERRERDGIHVATKWNVSETLSLRAEYEYGDINRIVVGRGVFNQWAGWDRTSSVAAPQFSGSFSGGIDRIGNDTWVYAPGAGLGIQNLRGLGQTNTGGNVAQMLTVPRPELGWADDVVIPSHEFHMFAPNTSAENPYFTYTLFANWNPVPNLYIEAAYNVQEQERHVDQLVWQGVRYDVNQVLSDSSPNPYFGELYADSRTRLQDQKNEIDDWRVAAAYQIKTEFTDQNILLLGGHRENTYTQQDLEFVRVDGTGAQAAYNNARNRVLTRRYMSQRDVDWSVPDVDPSIARWVTFGDQYRMSKTTYLQSALTGKWFEGRKLSTTLGLRWDENGGGSRNAQVDSVTREVTGLGAFSPNDKDSFVTKSVGAVYEFNETVSLYAGYAESFTPASFAGDIRGNDLDPEVNEGIEGGVRLNLLYGKLYGTIAYYDNTKTNRRESGADGDINTIWQELGSTERVPVNYSDTSSHHGTGWEFELVGSPAPGWNINANFALPEATLADGYAQTKAYYDANIAAWQAGLNGITDQPTRDSITQAIQNVETRIARFPNGRELIDSFDYTANLFTTYRFQEGRLKGFWIGGGVNFRGERLEAVDETNDVEYWEKGYSLISATLGYQGKWREMNYRVQLNVTNLLDEEIVRASDIRGTFTVNGVASSYAARNFLVLDPRRIQLTTTFTF